MKRLGIVLAAALPIVLLVVFGSHAGTSRGQIIVVPAKPHVFDPVRIELRAPTSLPLSELRLRARSPEGELKLIRTTVPGKGVRRGVYRFQIPGQWRVLVTDSAGVRVATVPARTVRVLDAIPTAPPAGFGPLGGSGCNPPSPANPAEKSFRDVFGTALGRELWALPFLPSGASWGVPDAAVFDGLVGKEMKIVFAMTSFQPGLRATGPTA